MITYFWSKDPEKNSVVNDYHFISQDDDSVVLNFIEEYKTSGGKGFGPTCSIHFTEDQLVEFIISAEKALQSIRS